MRVGERVGGSKHRFLSTRIMADPRSRRGVEKYMTGMVDKNAASVSTTGWGIEIWISREREMQYSGTLS